MPDDALSIVQRLAATFDRLGIPYLIGGSIASINYGEIRSTNDVDFVAELRAEHAEQIAEALRDGWYADGEMMADAIAERSSFNLIDFTTMLKADVFVAKDDAFTRQQFRRRQRLALGEPLDPVEAWVASPEDTLLQKLRWYRMGGEVSDRQWRDVLGVLKVQAGALDVPYMRQWAADLGVTDLLERALDDAGLTG